MSINVNKNSVNKAFLQPLACNSEISRGRLYQEADASTRSVFQRDRDRIIHCSAFRRLKYKTQVFVYDEGDHYRTRLTHSLEVAQIARSLSRFMGLNEDLSEALALAHDLGHTCFGHAGEDALRECMAPYNGFDHNAQSLRIVTKLEHRYAEFDGLNLTWETLEGLVKHNGPLIGPFATRKTPVPLAIAEYVKDQDLVLDSFPALEAQVTALSDDIAYNAHDIDDGLRSGLFTIEEVMEEPMVGPVIERVMARYHKLDRTRLINESLRRLISAMVNDVFAETKRRYDESGPRSVDDVRSCKKAIVAFSPGMAEKDKSLKQFLFANMYRHNKVNQMASKAHRVVNDLFYLLVEQPELMPAGWKGDIGEKSELKTARRVADYIAGMTDRYALDEHSRLSNLSKKA